MALFSPGLIAPLSETIICVAKRATLAVQHISHRHIGQQAIHVNHRIQRHRRRARVGPILTRVIGNLFPRAVGLLPAGELPVDEKVVHEKYGVTRGGRHLGHDGPNAVVSPGVWSRR